MNHSDILWEILELAQELIHIPSVSVGPEPRLSAIWDASQFISAYLHDNGIQFKVFNQGKYPAILAGFPGDLQAPVMLGGHFDVVAPEPDDRQFSPRIDGDFLHGRGAADMKVVIATYLVWMKHRLSRGEPHPPINLLLVGNEETGEDEPMGTPFVFKALEGGEAGQRGYQPEFLIAGERTGEQGNDLWGQICTENRGVIRFQVRFQGERSHSGTRVVQHDLLEMLLQFKDEISTHFQQDFIQSIEPGWMSSIRFPFLEVGDPGVYNITAGSGSLGIEIRPIPQEDLQPFLEFIDSLDKRPGTEISNLLVDPGIICPPDDPYLGLLKTAILQASGRAPKIGKKLAGTSARFAPGGRGVVWGQSGQGPHSRDERHFIPSIFPYFQALEAFGEGILNAREAGQILPESVD